MIVDDPALQEHVALVAEDRPPPHTISQVWGEQYVIPVKQRRPAKGHGLETSSSLKVELTQPVTPKT